MSSTSITPSTGWLLGPRFDIPFLLGPVIVGLGFAITGSISPALLMIAVLADLWLLGYHHVIASFTKLAGTADDRRQNFFLLYPLPLMVLIGVAFTAWAVGIWAITAVYFCWQWYHYVRQSYGVAAYYRRRAGRDLTLSPYAVQLMLWAVPTYGILNRASANPDTFLDLPIWLPPIPDVIVNGAGIVAALSVLYWIYTRIKAYQKGVHAWPSTLYMLSHFLVFYVGYVAINDITIGWLLANVWHNLQYIMFVWLYNTNRFARPESPRCLVGVLSQRTVWHIVTYFGFCLVLTTLLYSGISTLAFQAVGGNEALALTVILVLGMTANFHHYIIDSLIWKARHPTNARTMGLATTV